MCAACYLGDAVCWDVCIVSRSPRGLGRVMAIFVEVLVHLVSPFAESMTETKCLLISLAPRTPIIVFNATGQQLPKRAMSGALENVEQRADSVGRVNNGRTVWQRIIGCLA